MDDFEAQVQRVLREVYTDVVFRVNFRSCAQLAIEDVLGTDLDDDRIQAIIAAVRRRITYERRQEEHYRRQIIGLHAEHGMMFEGELDRTLARGFEL